MKNIFVAGSLNMDIVIQVDRFPDIGVTIHGETYFNAPGGKGANQAIAAARGGAKVFMAGAVGSDAYGKDLADNLVKNNVDSSAIVTKEGPSGTAFITVDSKGQNSIIVVGGSNERLTFEDISSFTHDITEGDIAISQLEVPIPLIKSFFREAQNRKAVTVLNPSPLENFSGELIPLCDFVVVNQYEGQILAQRIRERDPMVLAKAIIDQGVKHVVITLGDKGALYFDGTTTIRHPGFSVKPVDTTAAGDTFLGAFFAAYAKEKSIEECLAYGNAAGALATTKRGAQPSIPSEQEISLFLSKN